jgi:fimbrial chaperone protein
MVIPMPRHTVWLVLSTLLLVFCGCLTVESHAFSAYVSPARHELIAKPGQTISNVIEIGNDDIKPVTYRIYSADWTLDATGGAQFSDAAPTADSCRQWLRLERRQLKLAGRSVRKFRFEMHVPSNVQPTLCRLAIMIEDDAEAAADVKFSNVELPVSGRLGVIIYVSVGDINPNLQIVQITAESYQSRIVPVMLTRNTGTAHGRFEGALEGRDAMGRTFDFSVATLPVLPGETRRIPIWANDDSSGKPAVFTYPITLVGRIEWQGGKQEINTRIEAPPPVPAKATTPAAATLRK